MGPPWDVCHQALVPPEPSPIPSVAVRASTRVVGCCSSRPAGDGEGQRWGLGCSRPRRLSGVLPTGPRVTAVAEGDPQPSPPLPWEH